MAEKAPTRVPTPTRKALRHIEDQLTCPVCLEHFTVPKTLPCLHSFCQGCLDQLPVSLQRGGKRFISCPTCRQTVKLPVNGTAGLQSAFHLNSLLDVHGLLNKRTPLLDDSQQKLCENCDKEKANGYCSQCEQFLCQECTSAHKKWKMFANHEITVISSTTSSPSKLAPVKKQPNTVCTLHEKPLEFYCDTCEGLVCQRCKSLLHCNHRFHPIRYVFHTHKQEILKELQPVEDKLASITLLKQSLERQEGELLEQSQATTWEINALIEKLVKDLRQSQQRMCENVHTALEANMEKLSTRKRMAATAIERLQSVKQFTEEELKNGSQLQILVTKGEMVEKMRTACSQSKEDSLQPLKETKFTFLVNPSLTNAFTNVGQVFSQLHISARGKGLKTAMVGRKESFILEITGAVGTPLSPNLLSWQLTPAGDSANVVMCDVRHVTGGQFKVTYCSPTHGPHQLLTKVGGENIPGSPFTVNVLPSPDMRRKYICTHTGMWSLHEIAVSKRGNLLSCDWNNDDEIAVHSYSNVIALNPTTGEAIGQIGEWGSRRGQFRYPSGIAVSQDNVIVVSDTNNHRVQLFTDKGDILSSVGCHGHYQLQFKYPGCVAIDRNGKLFISDRGNHRIQVLYPNLAFSHCFKVKRFVTGIAIDSQGMVYVTNGGSRVLKLTPEGTCVKLICTNEDDCTDELKGICIDSNDVIYVINSNNCKVAMFNTDGEFFGYMCKKFGTTFNDPQYVAVDDFGTLYIVNDESEILVYSV